VVSRTEIEFVYKKKKLIYVALLVYFFTPYDALLMRKILSFYIQLFPQFVKPPSGTLRYFNMFHLAPSPSSLQIIVYLIP
jgi:hypothetical protein